jgi:hypothetical protein
VSLIISMLNSADQAQYFATSKRDPSAHRHVFVSGLDGVLQGTSCWCTRCKNGDTPQQRHADRDATTVQGPIQWATADTAQPLLTGSFNPVRADDWDTDAYANRSPINVTFVPVVPGTNIRADASVPRSTVVAAAPRAASSFKMPAPVKKMPAPVKKMPAPAKKMPAPAKKMPAPAKKTPAPVKKMPAPAKKMPAPAKKMPAPAKKMPAPAKKVFVATPNNKAAPFGIAYFASKVPHYYSSDDDDSDSEQETGLFNKPAFNTKPMPATSTKPQAPTFGSRAFDSSTSTSKSATPTGFTAKTTTTTTTTTRDATAPTHSLSQAVPTAQLMSNVFATPAAFQSVIIPQSFVSRLLLLLARMEQERLLDAHTKAALKDLVLVKDASVFAALEVYEVENDLHDLADTLQRIALRRQ